MRKLKEAFSTTYKETPQDLRLDTRPLVKKVTRGNVNLQLGRFASEHEIDERRESVCKYKFID